MKLSSDPHLKHAFSFRRLRYVDLLLELRELKGDFLWNLSFLCFLKHFQLVVNFHSDCTLIEKTFLSMYFLLHFPNSNNQFPRQTWIITFNEQIFFSPKFWLMAWYLIRLFYAFLEIFWESVHQLILGVTIYHWNCQSLRIMKAFDKIYWLFLSFVY